MWQTQVGDWEEALTKFKASQAEETLALANKEASIENRAMSLAEGQHLLLILPAPAHLDLNFLPTAATRHLARCLSCS